MKAVGSVELPQEAFLDHPQGGLSARRAASIAAFARKLASWSAKARAALSIK